MSTCRPQCLFRCFGCGHIVPAARRDQNCAPPNVQQKHWCRPQAPGELIIAGDHATRSSRHVVHLLGHRNVMLDARGGNAGGPTLLENPPVSGPAPLMQGGISATESLPFSRCRHLSEDKARSPKLALAKNLPCWRSAPCRSPACRRRHAGCRCSGLHRSGERLVSRGISVETNLASRVRTGKRHRPVAACPRASPARTRSTACQQSHVQDVVQTEGELHK